MKPKSITELFKCIQKMIEFETGVFINDNRFRPIIDEIEVIKGKQSTEVFLIALTQFVGGSRHKAVIAADYAKNQIKKIDEGF